MDGWMSLSSVHLSRLFISDGLTDILYVAGRVCLIDGKGKRERSEGCEFLQWQNGSVMRERERERE